MCQDRAKEGHYFSSHLNQWYSISKFLKNFGFFCSKNQIENKVKIKLYRLFLPKYNKVTLLS